MSAQNVEVVRAIANAWGRGDFSPLDSFDPSVELIRVDFPESGTWRGFEAMREATASLLAPFDEFRTEPEELIDAGDDVVVRFRARGRGKGSGADVDAQVGSVFTVRAGKVVRLALYWHHADALEAVGLTPEG